jgi:hypothetical protein
MNTDRGGQDCGRRARGYALIFGPSMVDDQAKRNSNHIVHIALRIANCFECIRLGDA